MDGISSMESLDGYAQQKVKDPMEIGKVDEQNSRQSSPYIPLRYWMTILCCLDLTFVFILRVNIGVTIGAMINKTAQADNHFKHSTMQQTSLEISNHQCPPASQNPKLLHYRFVKWANLTGASRQKHKFCPHFITAL